MRLASRFAPACAFVIALSSFGAAQPAKETKPKAMVLVVAVRQLPENLSPAAAWTDAEKQTLELLFESLVLPTPQKLGPRYRPQLAQQLPDADHLEQRVTLRANARWPDAEAVSAADIRHSYTLWTARSPALRDLLEAPRLAAPAEFDLTLRQGLFDPWRLLTGKVLPQTVRGKPLTDAADPEFAKSPVGSGPFVFAGRQKEGANEVVVLRRNPAHPGGGGFTEVRFHAWKDASKDLAAVKPHLVLGATPSDFKALRQIGLSEVRSLTPRRVTVLALNHRVAALGNVSVRRALALGLDRDKLVQEHFRGAEDNDLDAKPANGPFPLPSWAICPPPRVPEKLHQAELARSLAKGAGKLTLTLKCADDNPRHVAACAAVAQQLEEVFAGSLTLTVQKLRPAELRRAVEQRDFEIVLTAIDEADTLVPLQELLDPHPDALKPGGSNFLGYANDAKLQSLFHAIQARREFAARRNLTHDLHAHLVETMPFVPLWQETTHLAIRSDLKLPEVVDPLRIFADMATWKLK